MYTMMQVCRETDMTYQTLKYYCNEGLIPNVKRDKNNRRVFDEHDVKWIKDLVCLKKCGMSIQEMKEYLQLCLQGEATIPPASGTAGQKTRRAAGIDPGTGRQHRIHRLQARLLSRCACREDPLCQQSDPHS